MTTMIFTEKSRFKGEKHSVVCPQHGRIAMCHLETEAEQIAIDHEFVHITEANQD